MKKNCFNVLGKYRCGFSGDLSNRLTPAKFLADTWWASLVTAHLGRHSEMVTLVKGFRHKG